MNKKHWSLVLIFVLTVSLLPQMVLAQAPNYYTSIIVSDVTSGAPVVGGMFTTTVSLSVTNNASPQEGVMGADVYISFDPAIVSVDDADDNPANGVQVSISTEFFGSYVFVAANEIVSPCPNDAALDCVHIALSHSGNPITNKTGKIATITWGGMAAGPAGFGIDPDSVLADEDGQEFPINSTSVPAITVVAAGMLEGHVLRQGTRTDHALSDVVAYNSGGGVIATAQTDATGYFTLTVPLGGTYLVQAWYNGYLKAQKSNVYVVGATVALGTTTIPGGDVNSDNNINILDIVTIISRYGSTGAAATDPADINDDGTINIFDLTIAAGNFGTYGPLTW
ncbi:MAG: carboxypeptidase regulatory-like domain-containing protein [Anaerolineae bacterium]|nr:carboxypeptidase regulatory-like domain-containing protein [Anaerolineae bacterium]